MPLFHIHGLVAAVLASLHAGARSSALPVSRTGVLRLARRVPAHLVHRRTDDPPCGRGEGISRGSLLPLRVFDSLGLRRRHLLPSSCRIWRVRSASR